MKLSTLKPAADDSDSEDINSSASLTLKKPAAEDSDSEDINSSASLTLKKPAAEDSDSEEDINSSASPTLKKPAADDSADSDAADTADTIESPLASSTLKDLVPPSPRLHSAAEEDFIAISACFQCKRVDLKLIDFGGFHGCRGCMQITTRVTETALSKYSSGGSVRSIRSSASSRDEENETSSRDSDESEAAHALTALTHASANRNESEEASIENSDYDSVRDPDAGDSSDEERTEAGMLFKSTPQASRPNIELQCLVEKIIRERPETFEAVSVFQEPTNFTLYKPFDQSQFEKGIMDFGRWKLYKCPLVLKPYKIIKMQFTRNIGKPGPESPILSLYNLRRGYNLKYLLCHCNANLP